MALARLRAVEQRGGTRLENAGGGHVGQALLQLLGWVGWLGIGYAVWGRVIVGSLMVIGWWAAFWALLFFSEVTQAISLLLAVLIWVLVPPITAVALWIETRGEGDWVVRG
jgi:hypothetical protein